MGIRIHKAIGYAITDFKPPEDFDDTGGIMDRASNLTVGNFLDWCMQNQSAILALTKRTDESCLKVDLAKGWYGEEQCSQRLDECIKYDDEFGVEGVLMLTAPGCRDWQRYDDLIDYYAESFICKTSEPRLDKLPYGIYPFRKGIPPATIAGLCVWMGHPEIFNKLEEAIYTWWH